MPEIWLSKHAELVTDLYQIKEQPREERDIFLGLLTVTIVQECPNFSLGLLVAITVLECLYTSSARLVGGGGGGGVPTAEIQQQPQTFVFEPA